MAKRLIDTELWNNEEIIENFTAEDKYFWLYLLTSPHNNICGVFKNSPTLIARDMGLHKDTIVNLLYRFEKVHNLIFSDKETNEILILNWYKWNWTKSPKILSLIEKEIANIKSGVIVNSLQKRVMLVFEEVDTVSIGYTYPTITNSITNTNNIIEETIKKRKEFIAPTLEEIKAYALERDRLDLADKFFSYYQASEWKDNKGKKVKNWKLKFVTWENNNPKTATSYQPKETPFKRTVNIVEN